MDIQLGHQVAIPATYTEGPFPDEFLVTLKADQETISGFIKKPFVTFLDGTNAIVSGQVVRIEDDVIVIEIRGSFFTSNGVELVSKRWAREHMKLAA